MKLVMAWIFSIITFLGVVSQANSTCHEMNASSVAAVESQNSEIKNNWQQEDLNHNHQKDTDCSHSSSGCRNCHLGHCPFTLSPSIQVLVFDPNQISYFIKVSVLIYDFQTSPFRPPIA